MAHRILGIDLGSWSVKVAELEAGFRQTTLVGLYERRLAEPLEGESPLEQAARTLGELIDEQRLQPEMCATSLSGEETLRLLAMPFADPKKIEQVLGYELESTLLGDLDGLVLDHVVSGVQGGATNVIAVAASEKDVQQVIDALSAVGADPRIIGAAALSYTALREHAFATEEQPQVVLDIGHRHTALCVVRGGQALFARVIRRGGEDVTRAIIDEFHMSPADAETSKHGQAFILPAGATPQSAQHRRVDQCIREAVRPLVRELRQTLAAHRASDPERLGRIWLTGGGARLQGLAEHLSTELGLPVQPLELPAGSAFLAPDYRSFDGALAAALPAQAIGIALAAAAPVPQVNLRKGAQAYRSDFSFLRGKAAHLAAAVLTILVFAGVNAFASLRGLRKEGEALELQLRKETLELFGETRVDGKGISDELHQGPKGGAPPLPNLTGYDLLDEISRRVPEKMKLDVTTLEIKPHKAFLEGTVASAQEVDDLAAALKQIECFTDVQKGKVSSVSARSSGGSKDDKPVEAKHFSLTITTTCP